MFRRSRWVAHLLSTATFDLLAWTVVTWLVARIVRTGKRRLWLPVGLVADLALLNKPLIAAGDASPPHSIERRLSSYS